MTRELAEILDTFKEGKNYFSIIQLTLNNELLKLRFGILPVDFGHLKRILEFRPFENTGVAPYKYLVLHSSSNETPELALISVRVEQSKMHKNFKFIVSKKYFSNLLWFKEIRDNSEISQFVT